MEDYKYCPMCGSRLEWDFIEERDRQVCKSCGWINYLNPTPVVSCLVKNGKGELLLIRRGIEPCKGSWALPGGFIELNESLQEAGSRELREETGLSGKAGHLVGMEMQESRMYGTILTIGVEFAIESEDVSAGDDAAEARFFPGEELPEIPFSSQRKLVEEFLKSR
ncbi:MAG: NUDIX hydrolase [Candidatus Omnitrophota bacterium]|nr:NUDIX hydrolase [Candidatus Omnitrophota bacterium]